MTAPQSLRRAWRRLIWLFVGLEVLLVRITYFDSQWRSQDIARRWRKVP